MAGRAFSFLPQTCVELLTIHPQFLIAVWAVDIYL